MKLNLNNVALQVSAGLPKQFPADRLPQIAFSGRSNVGKSSLVNMLLKRKALARVSGEPGKTITVNFYNVDRQMYFVDLPGYGYAKRSPEDKKRWSALTDGYFTKNPNRDAIRLVCQLIDSRIGPTQDDWDMISYLEDTGMPFLLLATKSDKLNRSERNTLCAFLEEHLPDVPYILCSSRDGEGRDLIWQKLYDAL